MRSADEERSERLRSVDLTSGLDRVALARLAAYMDPIAVRAGDVVITEGDTGDALYIIVRGTFAVLAGPTAQRLNTIGPGHYVGELALLVDEPRSATIRADTDGEVLRLERQQFMELLGRDAPAARAVATTLARRLRRRDRARRRRGGRPVWPSAPARPPAHRARAGPACLAVGGVPRDGHRADATPSARDGPRGDHRAARGRRFGHDEAHRARPRKCDAR